MKKNYKEILSTSCLFNKVGLCDFPLTIAGDISSGNHLERRIIELYCVLHGEVRVIINKKVVQILRKGDAAFLKKKNDKEMIILESDRSVVMKAEIITRGIYSDIITYQEESHCLMVLNNNTPEISSCIISLSDCLLSFKRERDDLNVLLEASIALFFIQLYIRNSQFMPMPYYDCEHHLSRLVKDIMETPEYPWKVNEMAKSLQMSLNCFISKFKEFSGLTPLAFVQQHRLKKGKLKLECSDAPVSLIARECGYNSQASFTVYIKKHFGKSPLQIRKDARKNKLGSNDEK